MDNIDIRLVSLRPKSNRPEDVMDEEDLAELREGQNMVDTNDEMDLLAGRKLSSDARSKNRRKRTSVYIDIIS
jgi:hypothetical protein